MRFDVLITLMYYFDTSIVVATKNKRSYDIEKIGQCFPIYNDHKFVEPTHVTKLPQWTKKKKNAQDKC